ncbi:sigma 54-interacting transcriptional regulator [Desulfococcus sp.]|uniref:sigma 54-interacting transcriptional regulator n=1 Tax=Desulfococcus sp. TaxID=2025834 RepID=UPI003593FC0A
MTGNADITTEILDMVYRTVECSPDPVFWMDDSGRLYRANKAACRRFGLSPDDLEAVTIFDIDANCDASRWPALKHRLKNLPGELYESRFHSKLGYSVPVEVTGAPVEFKGRQLFCFFVRDISRCKRAHEASKASEARLRAIMEAFPDLVFVLDEDGRHIEVLTSQEELLYAAVKDIRGRFLHDIFEAPLADSFLKLTRETIRNQSLGVIEYELPIAGEIHCFEARTAPLTENIDGRPCIVWIARDITARKRAEDLQSQNVYLQEELTKELHYSDIIGTSAAMKRVFENIRMVADTAATVLLLGETGTGKELIARAIHKTGGRKGSPLIKVNCGALPAGLAESELFGHEKGAFTGAVEQKRGRFELAHHGTLFLDEVGETPPEIQIKLLRVLQEQEFERVGGSRTLKVDVRIIAATNRDLVRLVKDGRFREDLYYRLNIFPVKVPPLRERKEDIPLLARHFLAVFSGRMGKHVGEIEIGALKKLMEWSWPGNVRELANVLERAVILCHGTVLEKQHISGLIEPAIQPDRFPTLEEVERRHIQDALEKTGGVLAGPVGAASLLGINRSTLWSRMQKLGIRIAKKITTP